MVSEAEFFVYNLKSQESNLDSYFTKNFYGRASVFTSTLAILLGLKLQVALMDRKRLFWVKKKAVYNYMILMQIITLDQVKLDSKVLTNNQMYRREGCNLFNKRGNCESYT